MFKSPLILAAFVPLLVLPVSIDAQDVSGEAPIIDSIAIFTQNVFGTREAGANFLFALANSVRVKTQRNVIRRELLFDVGDPYDSARVAESARNLRALGIFQWVTIDSVRLNDELMILVQTADTWSTQLQIGGGSDAGVFTWQLGATESNFLGSAWQAGAVFFKEVDRNRWTFGLRTNRISSSRMAVGVWHNVLSDGKRTQWSFGVPFRALSDKHSWEIAGERAEHQMFQFVHRKAGYLRWINYWRRAFVNRAAVATAPVAGTAGYVRVGAMGIVRREEMFPIADTALAIADTVTGAVGAFVEYRKARFRVVRHFSSFSRQEDLDVGTTARLSLWFAPSVFGYQSTGVGTRVELRTVISFPKGFARLGAVATALVNGAGLDSGRVLGSATIGVQPLRRQATFVHVEAGIQKNVFPGSEFDLGYSRGPRGFGPHAFVGDRTVWGTFEHRVFLADNFANLLGVGFAGFFDYGGAWFGGSPMQAGGSVGAGLRLGMSRASSRNIGRLDLSYKFGDGIQNKRWVVSFGRGFAF